MSGSRIHGECFFELIISKVYSQKFEKTHSFIPVQEHFRFNKKYSGAKGRRNKL
jgi:hypothetical protein